MATIDCTSIAGKYAAWLSSFIATTMDDDGCRISTPFLLPDNTELGLYVEFLADRLSVTDRGETLDWLFLSGVSEEVTRLRIGEVASKFDLSIDHGDLVSVGTVATVAETIHRMATAIVEAAHTTSARQTQRDTRFDTEVERYFVHSGIPFEQSVRVQGKSGLRRFNYQLPMREGVALVGTLSATSPKHAAERAELIAFHALDVEQAQPSAFRYGCIIDDRSEERSDAVTEAAQGPLNEYLDFTIPWSRRNTLTNLQAA